MHYNKGFVASKVHNSLQNINLATWNCI